MLKNKKGYILTETMIGITVVATVITIVYGITMNYYIKQDNNITKYNTTQGLYSGKDIKKYFEKYNDQFIQELSGSVNIKDKTSDLCGSFCAKLNISKLYIAKHTNAAIEDLVSEEDVPNTVKSDIMKETIENNVCDYDYFIIYNDNSYSIIGMNCYE